MLENFRSVTLLLHIISFPDISPPWKIHLTGCGNESVMLVCIFSSLTGLLDKLIDTWCFSFQIFFEPKQWDYLVEQFKQEFCRLYGMPLEPLLNIFLQAGLSSLKTPYPLLIDLLLACNCSPLSPTRTHAHPCTCTRSCLIHY